MVRWERKIIKKRHLGNVFTDDRASLHPDNFTTEMLKQMDRKGEEALRKQASSISHDSLSE